MHIATFDPPPGCALGQSRTEHHRRLRLVQGDDHTAREWQGGLTEGCHQRQAIASPHSCRGVEHQATLLFPCLEYCQGFKTLTHAQDYRGGGRYSGQTLRGDERRLI